MKPKYFYGNNIVAASFVIQGVSIGMVFTYGVFFKEFLAEFGWSRAVISGASSMNFLITGMFGIFAGRLNDKTGPRVIVMAAGILLGLCYILMSSLHATWHLYLLYGVLAGMGIATNDIVTMSTMARWFVRRRGSMTGIVKVGTGFGQLAIPLIASTLIAVYGWRSSYLILGTMVFVVLLLFAQVMRRDPQAMGLLPDGASAETWNKGTESTESGISLKAAALTMQFWALCLAKLAALFCLLTVVVHIVPHAIDLGLPPATAAGVIAAIGGVSMVGRFLMGVASDWIGWKRSLIISFIFLICCLIWIQMANKTWMLFIFAIIYAFAHGGIYTVMSPAVAELFGTRSHGVIYGIVMFGGSIGGAIGPLLAGHIFDVTGSYRIAFLLLTVMAVIGLMLITLLRPLSDTVRETTTPGG
ncbi:MFS transporter [Thermodesulfobacteriota bacterium]